MPRGVTWSEVLSWGAFGDQHQWDPAQLAARRDRFSHGQGLAAALLRVALAHGVEVRTDAPVTRLVVESGRVTGVAVASDGGEQVLQAQRGVLLACGGYEGNPTLMAALEDFGDAPTHFPPGVTGDGLIMAAEHGALVRKVALRLSTMLGYFVPGEHPDAPPHFQSTGINELAYPHTIVVNRRGARFADESFFQGIVPRLLDFDVPTHQPANRPCYLVFDAQFARRYRIRRAGRLASRFHPGCRTPTRRGRSPSAWALIPMGWKRPRGVQHGRP